MVLFDNAEEFAHIKTKQYKEVTNKIQPKIVRLAKNKGLEYFTKYCFFALREKLKVPTNKNEGKIITSTIFCMNKETPDPALEKFYNDFNNNYSDEVYDENDFNKIQRYRKSQIIDLQYYTGMGKKADEGEIPDFYSAFGPEGMVMNKSKDQKPQGLRHSFRYDQVVNCGGSPAADLKKALEPKVANAFRPDDCCISYLLNWDGVGSNIMMCSVHKKMWKCKAEIKIVRSTMFDFCMTSRIKNLFQSRKNEKIIEETQMGLIERLGIVESMHLMLEFNLKSYPSDTSIEYKTYELQKKRNELDFIANIKRLDYELASPGKKYGGCKEYKDESK